MAAGDGRAPKVRIAGATSEVRADDAKDDMVRDALSTVGPETRRDASPEDESAEMARDATPASATRDDPGLGGTVAGWLTHHFPGHERAAFGALCGLVVALLVFAIGFLRTLLVVVLVGGGAAVGQFFDGDPRIAEIVRQFMSERRG